MSVRVERHCLSGWPVALYLYRALDEFGLERRLGLVDAPGPFRHVDDFDPWAAEPLGKAFPQPARKLPAARPAAGDLADMVSKLPAARCSPQADRVDRQSIPGDMHTQEVLPVFYPLPGVYLLVVTAVDDVGRDQIGTEHQPTQDPQDGTEQHPP